jgi:CRISPR-associated protein Cas1
VTICLPDETHLAMAARDDDVAAQLELFAPPDDGPVEPPGGMAQLGDVRRLLPARDDLRPLYLTGHGLTVGNSGEVLQVREYGKGKDRSAKLAQEVRIGEVSQVNLFGTVQLTPAAIQGLCWAEKPIAHFSFGGWFYGLTLGLGLRNVFLRRDRVARDVVASKIRNHPEVTGARRPANRSLNSQRLQASLFRGD